jgi:ferredoxin
MSVFKIDLNRCDASPFCPVRRVCPTGAVTEVAGGYKIDEEACTSCGTCVRACPMGAVSAP